MQKKKILFPYPLKKPLLLVGMMGCGKTSLGRRLASLYNLEFIDTDIELEKAGGGEISYLFERFGEADFRRAEERVMERILNGKMAVIASGGGAFISESTRKLAKEKAVTIFLNAHTHTIYKNTQGRSHRPLLNVPKPKEVIEKLLHKRIKYYQEADIQIRYKQETLYQLTHIIASKINNFSQNGGEI